MEERDNHEEPKLTCKKKVANKDSANNENNKITMSISKIIFGTGKSSTLTEYLFELCWIWLV